MNEVVWALIIITGLLSISIAIGFWWLSRDLFSPGILVTIGYSAYTLIFVLAVVQGIPTLSNSYTVYGLQAYFGPQVLGLVGLVLGVFLAQGLDRRLKQNSVPIQVGTQALFVGVALWFFVGWGMMALLITKFGGISSFLNIGYGAERYVVIADTGFLGFGVDWLIVVYALLAYIWISGRWRSLQGVARFLLFIIAASFPFWIYLLLITGGRSNILRVILIVILLRHYIIRPFRLGRIVLFGALLYVVMVLYGHVRNELKTNSPIEVARIAVQKVKEDPAILLPTSFGEFINPARALYDLANHNVDWDYWLGKSYLNTSLVFFPKALLPDRPQTPAEWYVSEIDPEFATDGGGLGFVTVAEGYLNFGLPGAFIHMLLFSFVIALTYYRFRRSHTISRSAFVTFTFIIFYVFVLEAGIRIDIAPVIKTFTFGYLLPYISIFFLASLLKRKVSNSWSEV